MALKQRQLSIALLLATGWIGPASADPARHDFDRPGHASHSLSENERERMRSDLERFSHQLPGRAQIDKRRQLLRDRARQRFQDADTDHNGRLNRDELARLNPHAVRFFDRVDRDGDGELNLQEVAQALRARIRQQYRQRP